IGSARNLFPVCREGLQYCILDTVASYLSSCQNQERIDSYFYSWAPWDEHEASEDSKWLYSFSPSLGRKILSVLLNRCSSYKNIYVGVLSHPRIQNLFQDSPLTKYLFLLPTQCPDLSVYSKDIVPICIPSYPHNEDGTIDRIH